VISLVVYLSNGGLKLVLDGFIVDIYRTSFDELL